MKKKLFLLAVILGILFGMNMNVYAADALSIDGSIAKQIMAAWDELETECAVNTSYSMDQVMDLYLRILKVKGKYFYVKPYVRVKDTGTTIKIQIEYTASQKTLEPKIKKYEQAVQSVMNEMNKDWSDYEKVLFLNDYICDYCAFDYENSKNNTVTEDSLTAYGVLVQKKSMCQGYALAFQDLCERAGIACQTVISDQMDHEWNMVRVGGKYYMVDVTWNDPYWDMVGRVKHQYFLKSMKYFTTTGKHVGKSGKQDYVVPGGWNPAACKYTTYDSSFLDSIDTKFVYYGGKWYGYNGSNAIARYKWDGTKLVREKNIIEIKDKWQQLDKKGYYWTKKYFGMGKIGQFLIYSDTNHIYAYNLKKGATSCLYTNGNTSKNIYGLSVKEDGSAQYLLLDAKGANAYLKNAGSVPSSSYLVKISKLIVSEGKHFYGIPKYTWSSDYKKCTAKVTCLECSGAKSYSCTVTSEVYKQATVTAKGVTRYTATVKIGGQKYTTRKDVTNIPVKALSKANVTSVTAVNGGLTVRWGKVTGASGYDIYRKVGSGSWSKSPIAKISSGGTVTYTDKSVKSGTTYSYAVRAKNSAQTVNYGTSKSYKYLSQPGLLTPTMSSDGITVKWNKVTGAAGYYVYRKTGSGKFEKIGTVKSGSTVSYLDKKATNGSTVVYTVAAYSGSSVSAKNSTGKTYVYVSPTKISSAANKQSKSMTVSYAKNEKASGYQIQYSTSKSFESAKSVTVSGASSLSKTITKLVKGKTYYVRVRCTKKVGSTTYYSTWSAVKTVKISQ